MPEQTKEKKRFGDSLLAAFSYELPIQQATSLLTDVLVEVNKGRRVRVYIRGTPVIIYKDESGILKVEEDQSTKVR